MNELTIALLVVLLFGVGIYIHGHYFLYREGLRLKKQIEREPRDSGT